MTAATVAEVAPAPGGVRGFLRLVVIEHSVFALPFAYIAALTATHSIADDVAWRDLALITVAMVAGRTFAMAANRVIDREIDARNPRTEQRELVTGALPLHVARAGIAVSLVVFLVAATLLSPLCLMLAPVALLLLTLYPYAKRVTWLCHAVLGLAQAVAPVGAWIAITDEWSGAAVVLGLAVGSWIGGFDIIYACQDVAVDRREGLHSVPARFGVAAALRASAIAHVGTVALLVWFGVLADLVAWWQVGVALAALALGYEHSLVKPHDLSKVGRAFFTVNGYVGIGLFAFAVLALAATGLRW